jgi:hypothetical protein
MKACMASSPPVEAQSRVLAGCAYKRGRTVSFRPSRFENGWEATGIAHSCCAPLSEAE